MEITLVHFAFENWLSLNTGIRCRFCANFLTHPNCTSPLDKAEGRGQMAEGKYNFFYYFKDSDLCQSRHKSPLCPHHTGGWWSSINECPSPYRIVLYLLPSAFCLLPLFFKSAILSTFTPALKSEGG